MKSRNEVIIWVLVVITIFTMIYIVFQTVGLRYTPREIRQDLDALELRVKKLEKK